MKALVYHLAHTFPFNPENCVPYDGVEFYTVFLPLDTDREAYEENLNEEKAQHEFGLAGFDFDGEMELDENEYVLYDGEYITLEEMEMEKYAAGNPVNEFGEAI